VTAKWKEQGVYIAVTDIASWFNYGVDGNSLRQVFLTELVVKAKNSPPVAEEQLRTACPADQQDPTPPSVPENEPLSTVNSLCSQPHFERAKKLTFDTFALALRRIRDKNVLPHVHIMLSFLSTLASNKYVSHLLADTPWAELIAFLNTLIKAESQIQSQIQSQIDSLFTSPVFPNEGERSDELPLPEDYLVRGLIWAHGYFPRKWFEREQDGEERYLELASTVKSRMERVLRLGYALASITTFPPMLTFVNANANNLVGWKVDSIRRGIPIILLHDESLYLDSYVASASNLLCLLTFPAHNDADSIAERHCGIVRPRSCTVQHVFMYHLVP
jgi:hypothetical protein